MELKRLSRAIGDRWATVVFVALLGVLAAILFTTIAGRNQTDLFEATAAIRFVPQEGETIADLADDLAEAQNLASIAAGDLLERDPSLFIVEDLANARLLFIAQGTSNLEASNNARLLLQAYLDVDPTVGEPVDGLLMEIVQEAIAIQDQIDSLEPPVTPAQAGLIEALDFLDQQINAIDQRLVAILVQEAGADAEGRRGIASERAALTARRAQLKTEQADLGARPGADQRSPGDALLFATLLVRQETLTAEYGRLFLRKLGVAGEGGVDPVAVRDLTPEPVDPVLSASMGLLGGLLIAVLAIVFVNRTRKTVWLAEDVEIPMLGNVPARRIKAETAEIWYDESEPGPRKAAIQALRSAVEAQVPPDGATIALTGLGVESEGVQALAADLASSMASAGTSVLLVDANFGSRSPLGQYKVGGSSLSRVLKLNALAPEFNAEVSQTIESAFMVRSGLSVIPSGPAPASPADALAGRQFRRLVAIAQEQFDVVVVVVDNVDSPSAQVAMQRLGYGILVLTPGRVTTPAVDGTLSDIARFRISLLGCVFLEKQDRLSRVFRKPPPPISPKPPTTVDEDPQSPISRLHNYPIPEERRTAVVPHGSLDDLATHMGATAPRNDWELGLELLEAINAAGPEKAHDRVAEYLVAQTEDMVTARHGHGGLSAELIEDVASSGFMPLRPIRGYKTPEAWISHEIESEVDVQTADELISAIQRSLGLGEPRGIDSWLTEEFFIRHLEHTDGEPAIWHLTSPEGTVSLLVPARRLDVHQIESLISDVAASQIDDIERYRKSMIAKGDHEQAAVFEGQIHDVRAFERALRGLVYDEDGVKRGTMGSWKPDWSKGTRFNLAPLQRAGLLAFKVLTDEEVSELLASA